MKSKRGMARTGIGATTVVYDEAALNAAVNESGPQTVVLGANIELAEKLVIRYGKKITLKGDFTLFGPAGQETITINAGELTIDGITVTHRPAETGAGVIVSSISAFTLESGKIINNTETNPAIPSQRGAGVTMNGGKFTMNGGEISGNSAITYGGGMYVGGSFKMNGGSIHHNRTQETGGGLLHAYLGTFEMTGGSIHHNTAKNSGGVDAQGPFTMTGGDISANEATENGGGVANHNSSMCNLVVDGGRITGNVAGRDGGGVISDRAFTMKRGEISANTAVRDGGGLFLGGPNAKNQPIEGGTIQANRCGRNGGGICMAQVGTIDISGAVMLTGNGAGLDGGGIYVPCDCLPSLSVGPDVTFADNSAARAYERRPQDDAIYASRILASSWSDPFEQGYNGHDIAYPCGIPVALAEVSIEVQKQASGAGIKAGQFAFGLHASSDPDTMLYRETCDGNGKVQFPSIPLLEGTYDFTVCELSQSGLGWTVDPTDRSVRVSVDASGAVTFDPPVTTFTNAYVPAPTEVAVFASVFATGASLKDGQFEFGLYDSSGALVESAHCGASGTIAFPAITFGQAGTFSYEVREISQSADGWTVDPRAWPVTASVTDDGIGNLHSSVEYPMGVPVFENSYMAKPAQVVLSAAKAASGAALPAGLFNFGVFDGAGNLIATGTNGADGKVAFSDISLDGKLSEVYAVREISLDGGGWTVDSNSSFRVGVEVADNGLGQFVADLAYLDGPASFLNTYSAQPASESVHAYKSLKGWSGPEKRFGFGLYDSKGMLVSSGQNISGTVAFPQITYLAPGRYEYTVRETSPGGQGWTVDPNEWPVSVTVTDDGAGQLLSSVDYPKGPAVFTNSYAALPARLYLHATADWQGGSLPARQIAFSVYDEAGSPISIGTNDENGNIDFAELVFSKPGIYACTVAESSPDANGWSGDRAVFPVTFTVSDDGQGQLVAIADFPAGQPHFSLTYSAAPAMLSLSASKAANGGAISAGQFCFTVSDQAGDVVARACNDGNGDISFPAIEFASTGVESFDVQELPDPQEGWTQDKATFPITVSVTDNGSGNLVADVSFPLGQPAFLNVYDPNPIPVTTPVTLFAKATLLDSPGCKARPCPGTVSCTLMERTGKVVAVATNDSEGYMVFPALDLAEGAYDYRIVGLSAIAGQGHCPHPCPRAFSARVTVTFQGASGLCARVDYPCGFPSFPLRCSNGRKR